MQHSNDANFTARYRLSKPGSLCIDENYDPVTDKKECKLAFSLAFSLYVSDISTGREYGGHPKWCFLYVKKGANFLNVNWNVHPTGKAHAESRQVCKKRGGK